jgi:hypothetical protein
MTGHALHRSDIVQLDMSFQGSPKHLLDPESFNVHRCKRKILPQTRDLKC